MQQQPQVVVQVLITGAGMVAAHAARSLMQSGHPVTLFSATPRPDYIRRVVGRDAAFIQGDVRELPSLVAAVGAVQPEVVVHTAARIGVAAQANPYAGFQVNVGGSLNVAEAVRLQGVRRLLHTSTLGVHDLSQPQPAALDENFPVGAGARIYGATKVACEQLLMAYSRAYDFELGLLRLAGVYGYGEFTGGSGIGREIMSLVTAARDRRAGRLGAGMPDRYELVHVKDVANGILRAAVAPQLPHDVYNIGTGVLVTREDVVTAMRTIVPSLDYDSAGERREDPHPRLQPMDLSRSKADLGYEPTRDLASGLADLLAEVSRPVGAPDPSGFGAGDDVTTR